MLVCIVLHKVDTISPDGRELLCRERERVTPAQEERVVAEIRHLVLPEVEAVCIPIRAVHFCKYHGLAWSAIDDNEQHLVVAGHDVRHRIPREAWTPRLQRSVEADAPQTLGRMLLEIENV